MEGMEGMGRHSRHPYARNKATDTFSKNQTKNPLSTIHNAYLRKFNMRYLAGGCNNSNFAAVTNNLLTI